MLARLLVLALAALLLAAAPALADDDDRDDEPDVASYEDDDDDDDDEDDEDLSAYDGRVPDAAWQQSIRLTAVPRAYDGSGVTVAVLDTGVTRHDDLGDRVAARVDLMPEGDGYDRYGHGTHMTGVIAGDGDESDGRWTGAAPGASVLPVKVAGWNGATDVSAVLAGLEWIAAHRQRYGIRVVNLSYGTDSSQAYAEDPLNHAVERLSEAGVLVVVGAGNRGPGTIDKPGDDPFVVTVGAADTRGTADQGDDVVASFSGTGPAGDGLAKPDLVAPGVSIVSHRAPDSTVDALRPKARVDEDYFKGTGTSQAAAVVSGVAARMFEADPALTADEAKAALTATASPALAGQRGAGAGLVDAAAAVEAVRAGTVVTPAAAGAERSTGLGSLDSSRGSFKPYTDHKEPGKPEQLSGELDALGRDWDARSWAQRPWTEAGWATSPWARHTAVAAGWDDGAVAGEPWSGLGWDENSWSAKYWGDVGIPDLGWTAKYWGSAAWNGSG